MGEWVKTNGIPFWSRCTTHSKMGPPILVYFSGDWDVLWEYGILTYGGMGKWADLLISGFDSDS